MLGAQRRYAKVQKGTRGISFCKAKYLLFVSERELAKKELYNLHKKQFGFLNFFLIMTIFT